jgi:SAM-dependent methyltransferase
MPGQQGVMPWPAGMPNVSTLCEEGHWPLANGVVDRLVMLHGLETSDDHRLVLREAARVMADGGRAIFIVPNRRGLWARGDGTPFGYGRSYSLGQIEAQLEEYGFRPQRHAAALFAPPSTRRFWLRTAPFWESLGRGISSHLAGGVLMVEAKKALDEPARGGLREAVRRPMRVLEGLGGPAPEPARRGDA